MSTSQSFSFWSSARSLLLYGLAAAAAAAAAADAQSCRNLVTQQGLNLNQVMGRWVVLEVLMHSGVSAEGSPPPVTLLKMCPIVHLNRTSSESLILEWSEPAGDLSYHLRIAYPTRPDYWVVVGPQRGELADKHDYQQFIGTIQVLKAVMSHTLIIFCSRSNNDRLYTLLLARDTNLSRSEVKGVHNMLERRNLPVSLIKKACSGSSSLHPHLSLLLFVSLLMAKLFHTMNFRVS